MKMIGLAGPAGVGKTTAARALADTLAQHQHGSRIASFADPIREMAAALIAPALGMSTLGARLLMQDPIQKEIPLPLFGAKSPRELLQTLGTEWGRDLISPTLWTDLAYAGAIAQPADFVIFDDVRFREEADMIADSGGWVIGLSGRDATYGSHRSARSMLTNSLVSTDQAPEDVAEDIWREINAKTTAEAPTEQSAARSSAAYS